MDLLAGVAALLALGAAQAPRGAGTGTDHAAAVGRIVGAELVEGRAYEILSHLTDRIGPRLSGSAGAEEAVRWTHERLKSDGLQARLEPVKVPHWVRGAEEAEVLEPVAQRLLVTALGGSVPTPDDGVTAEVVEAQGLEGLKALDDAAVRGRIVLFNRAMVAGDALEGYGAVSPQRTRGATEAARRGAVAVLVRSIGTLNARLVHTGAVTYAEATPRIPAAAVTAEDADLLHRLLTSGRPPRVRLRLGCRTLPDADSANVVADLPGRTTPEEIVLIGAHLDSWDLGTGALDDGAGVAMVMESLRLLKSLGLVPRRTIRGVLFMNEENGLRGSRAYAAAHAGELERHVAALEADSGADRPQGFLALVGEGGLPVLERIVRLLEPVGPRRVRPVTRSPGADIGSLRPARVPLLGLELNAGSYFDWHHTPGDTLDKVDPRNLAQATAAMAAMAYVLADMPDVLPRPPAPSPSPSPSP
jgi:carboxypeptidase Q